MFATRADYYRYWRQRLRVGPVDPLPKEILPDPVETEEDVAEVFGPVKPDGTIGKRPLDTK
jgi:hypothetical protein